VDAREALAGERAGDGARLADLAADDLGRNGRGAGAVALADDRGGRVEQHRVGGHAVALGHRPPGRAAARVQAGRVDHRGQPSREALGDDQVEHLEGVAARALVALAATDRGAQRVRGDDLAIVEPARGPLGLA
jgi:hypothetical protein